jgi:hypothetical protein
LIISYTGERTDPFERTYGVVGLLERLIEDGCREAIDSGQECLTEDLLEDIAINVAEEPGRDPDAGEIPDIPAPSATGPRRAAKGKRRGRNTVFDDRGPAASTGT